MRIYYFDDSGDRGKDPNAPYLVMGGFGIDADQVHVLQANVRRAANGFGFRMQHPHELKFNHVGRNSDNKSNKPHWMIREGITVREKRRALVYACLREALRTPTARVLAVAVHQPSIFGNRKPIEHGLHPLLERINMDCAAYNTSGLIVMDEEQADDKALRAATRGGSAFMQFGRLIDTISFMPSDESIGVQIADLIAGAIGRYLNHQDPGYLRVIWPRVRHVHGQRDRYGIKLYPKGQCLTPPVQPVPWPNGDRLVHEYEMQSTGRHINWHWDGSPDWIFTELPENG
ncbi:hypothetical protein CXX84_01045 [Arthrobacter sp. AFG7.2]|uniref:DUF3800 domain-containing protein n=1 Tax=Arthrobacter sp. AFG7.2 TaxID=1688693 RepID=UPI000C9DB6BA|nr:DUF3800 domain-containing protein [Arthrobacter sp. AFG7.2]PNI10097.1 hypothetical protein CXX84_01045 [Arthrobacter sp. AFG7.2]